MIWLIIALVQIITESFPISSSGHVKLITALLHKIGYVIPACSLVDEITALPTLLVIGICYVPCIMHQYALLHWYQIITFWLYIGIATVPTVIVYGYVHYCNFKPHIPLWIGFAISALLLWSTRYAPVGSSSFSLSSCCIIGIAQAITLFFPGVSRMATTYTIACWLGITSSTAFELSIAFEIPLLCGALLKITLLQPQWWHLYTRIDWLSTVLIAMAPAMIGLRYMMMLADGTQLWYVSYYLVIPCIVSMLV